MRFGVFDFAVFEVILNQPGIGALIGEGEATGMAQHVGMGAEGQGSGGAVPGQSNASRSRYDPAAERVLHHAPTLLSEDSPCGPRSARIARRAPSAKSRSISGSRSA